MGGGGGRITYRRTTPEGGGWGVRCPGDRGIESPRQASALIITANTFWRPRLEVSRTSLLRVYELAYLPICIVAAQ